MSEPTIQDILREGGKYRLRDGRAVYSEKAFKREFKVGDLIAYGPRGTGRITAIGERRFFYKVTGWNGHFTERAATIRNPKGWGKP